MTGLGLGTVIDAIIVCDRTVEDLEKELDEIDREQREIEAELRRRGATREA